jgi:hypothetical protein
MASRGLPRSHLNQNGRSSNRKVAAGERETDIQFEDAGIGQLPTLGDKRARLMELLGRNLTLEHGNCTSDHVACTVRWIRRDDEEPETNKKNDGNDRGVMSPPVTPSKFPTAESLLVIDAFIPPASLQRGESLSTPLYKLATPQKTRQFVSLLEDCCDHDDDDDDDRSIGGGEETPPCSSNRRNHVLPYEADILAGYSQHRDPDGRPYWYSIETRTSIWSEPEAYRTAARYKKERDDTLWKGAADGAEERTAQEETAVAGVDKKEIICRQDSTVDVDGETFPETDATNADGSSSSSSSKRSRTYVGCVTA